MKHVRSATVDAVQICNKNEKNSNIFRNFQKSSGKSPFGKNIFDKLSIIWRFLCFFYLKWNAGDNSNDKQILECHAVFR